MLTLRFEDAQKASHVEAGMNVRAGELTSPALSVGSDENGNPIAIADFHLPDGSYEASLGYKSTQIIR